MTLASMSIEERHDKSVSQIIKPLVSDSATKSIFLLWPVLVTITSRFCDFVSPLMPYDSQTSLVKYTIQDALRAYREEKNELRKPHAYIMSLSKAAVELMQINVRGMNKTMTLTWEPFIVSMKEWMVHNDIQTLCTSIKAGTLSDDDKLLAKRSLLTQILTVNEMKTFDIAL